MYFASPVGGAEADSARAAVETFWDSSQDAIASGVVWDVESEVPVINDATGDITAVFAAVTPRGGSGSQAAHPLPFATQLLCRWLTDSFVGGRRVRGRTFVPGLTEASNDTDGKPLPGTVTAFQEDINALVASSAAELVIWRRPSETNPVGSSHIVTAGSVWSEWAVLRSRRD